MALPIVLRKLRVGGVVGGGRSCFWHFRPKGKKGTAVSGLAQKVGVGLPHPLWALPSSTWPLR